jgi:uncharacterized protein (DUF433 family)
MTSFRDRIAIDPAICHGVGGLRYPVEMILELLSSGMTHDEILADYPDLQAEDIFGVLEVRDASESRQADRSSRG